MSVKKGKGPIFDPGLCRCCGTMKKCRLLNVEYECLGQKEVYMNMIIDCFGLLLSHLDGKPTERLVCATCVMRLREAVAFREQVLQCEEAFVQMKKYDAEEDDPDVHMRMEEALVEWVPKVDVQVLKVVKVEPQDDSEDVTSACEDALDTAQDYDGGIKEEAAPEECNSNDDLPLRACADKLRAEPPNSELRKRQLNGTAPPLQQMIKRQNPDVHMRMQEALVEGVPKMEVQVVKVEPQDDSEDVTSACEDALDTAQDCDGGIKEEAAPEECNSNDDLPLRACADKLRAEPPNSELRKRQLNGTAPPLQQMIKRQKLPMSKVQQMMRERDPTYTTETNILTIVEFSYVCPFKCRHNHLLCYYCGRNFTDPTMLRQHTENAHHPKKFKVTERKNMIKVDLTRIDCRLCPIVINNLEEFKKHIATVHSKKYYFDHKDLVLPFRLTKEEMKCAICDMIFPYFHALNTHMNKHYINYVCETCGLGFVGKGRFVMHQQRHEDGDFPCETCGKIFKGQYNRDLHIDRVHKKRGRVYCPKCDIRLMSYPQKLKHLVEVHGEESPSFPCNMCDKVCETRRTLTIHRRKDHLKDYRYECGCCEQKFFTQFGLDNHMPTHTKERNFKCKVCQKSYTRLKTLKAHMRIHTNDRRYKCHICGHAFMQNCKLKVHMKRQHPQYG